MLIDKSSGLIEGFDYISSPNCDRRPENVDPELLVIHGISLPPGEYGGPHISELFCNRLDAAAHPYFQQIVGLRVSAHLLIRRDGSLIQYVPLHQRAWHAGQSSFCGRSACNDFSIGVELEGCDDQPYESVQYRQLIALSRSLMQAYPAIDADRIVGHSDIAPGRKTDPGPAFDWQRYRRGLG